MKSLSNQFNDTWFDDLKKKLHNRQMKKTQSSTNICCNNLYSVKNSHINILKTTTQQINNSNANNTNNNIKNNNNSIKKLKDSQKCHSSSYILYTTDYKNSKISKEESITGNFNNNQQKQFQLQLQLQLELNKNQNIKSPKKLIKLSKQIKSDIKESQLHHQIQFYRVKSKYQDRSSIIQDNHNNHTIQYKQTLNDNSHKNSRLKPPTSISPVSQKKSTTSSTHKKVSQKNAYEQGHNYWKQKVNSYQQQLFLLRNQNCSLKQQIQKLKRKQIKNQQQLQKLKSKCQSFDILQQTVIQLKKTEKDLYIHIMKIQKQLTLNKALLNGMQNKIILSKNNQIKNNLINDAPLIRDMKNKLRKVKQENMRLLYVMKQMEEELKVKEISSIWIGHAKRQQSMKKIKEEKQSQQEQENQNINEEDNKIREGSKQKISKNSHKAKEIYNKSKQKSKEKTKTKTKIKIKRLNTLDPYQLMDINSQSNLSSNPLYPSYKDINQIYNQNDEQIQEYQ